MSKLLWSVFFILLMLSGCGFDGTPTRSNDFVPLTSIEIVAGSPAIAAGTSSKLSVLGNFSGFFTRDITDQVVWSSDTPDVAGFVSAASPSRVTGRSPGSATLTATVAGVSANFTLTVSSATISSITLTPASPTIAKGLGTQFTASGSFSDSTTQDLTFDVVWASDNPAVATVSDVVGSKGLAQALAAGNSTISATFPLNGVSGSTLMTVTEPVLQSITVTPANPSILTLSSVSFKATGNLSDGTTADLTSQVTWSSSQTGFATIAGNGAATTLTQGTTVISASQGTVSGTTNLKVTGGNLTTISLSTANIPLANNSMTMVRDTVERITATGTFSNGATRDITGVVVWATSNTNSATVTTSIPRDSQALLNALAVTPAAAPTRVTANSGTLTDEANLTIKASPLLSIAISPTSLDLTSGTSDRFRVTATFNDGTIQDVTTNATWTSVNAAIATVGDSGFAKGRVTGVATGSATITAAYGGATATALATVRTRIFSTLTIGGTPGVVSGNQAKFTATASYGDGTIEDVTENTTWNIDNPFVAILADNTNQPGQVVGVDSGSATLTASFGGKTQTTTITVP